MQEIWKDVEGYEGLYKVSNRGRVWSERSGKILRTRSNKGYPTLKLHYNKVIKTYFVHRLVAMAFIDNPENKREINHIDENKLNNSANNLMWATAKENANWGTRNKRISETVQRLQREGKYKRLYKRSGTGGRICQIDIETGKAIKIFNSVTEASKHYGYHQGNISSCCTGKLKSSKGYKWMYYNDYLKTKDAI